MLYLVEAVTALATPMLIVSIYFYTEKKFGWSMRRNLLLAAAEGAVYVAGSLLANPISRKFGRRRSVLALFILAGTVAIIGALMTALPVSWVYMGIRNDEEYDQSLINTIIVLPMVVTGIVKVCHSLVSEILEYRKPSHGLTSRITESGTFTFWPAGTSARAWKVQI